MKKEGNYPKRFLITRNNTKHRHYNEDEVYAELEPYGFFKLAPETLSFEQQMGLFYQAEWIIGGSGAAFTNLVLCSEKCHAVIFDKKFPHLPPVFTPPACFNGVSMIFFTSTDGEEELNAHSDYTIDIVKFKSFVKNYLNIKK